MSSRDSLDAAGGTTFFVTGSSGSLGGMLIRKILTDDAQPRLILLEHHSKILVEEKYRDRVTIIADMPEDPHTLQGVDAVIHLAATTHAKHRGLYRVVNTDMTERLLRLAKESGVKHFVYVSTTAIGGACGLYGASKFQAEGAVRQSGVPYTIVRFAEVYGAPSREGIERLTDAVMRFPVVPYVTNTFLAPVYVDDAITALRTAIYRSPEHKTYIIAGPEILSFSEVVGGIASALRKKVVRIPVPRTLLRIARRALSFFVAPDQVERLICEKDYNIELATQDLKFSPRSFREGLKDTPLGRRR